MDKEKKKEEFFDGKSEVGTNPIVTFVHVAIVCLKKIVHSLALKHF